MSALIGKRHMNIYDVISEWELNGQKLNFRRYTRTTISAIANDVQNCYRGNVPVQSGRFHQSLATATDIVENRRPIEELALPLLYSRQLVLPDPVYSVLAPKANSIWHHLPESGCKGYSDTPLIQSQWKNYWSTPSGERIEYLNSTIPALVAQLMKLKPLVETGFILLQPWEVAVETDISSIKNTALALKQHGDLVKDITQKLRQAEYNLGIRLGPISIVANQDVPATGLKKGDELWIAEKTGILVVGLIHSLLASRYQSDFVETLPGDRLVYDFVRTDGILRPPTQDLSGPVRIPHLSSALWPDIVAIKKDSELLERLQQVLETLAYCDSDEQIQGAREKLLEVQSQLVSDASFTKRMNLPISELIVTSAVGVASNLITGAALEKSMLAAGLAGSVPFACKLVSAYFDKDNRAARKRRDLIVRVNSRIQ